MQLLIISFILSLIITILMVRYKRIHLPISGDTNLSAPQKFHKQIVPRIGGAGIFLSLLITSLISYHILDRQKGLMLLSLCFCCSPCFITGLLEDLSKKGYIKIRFISTLITGLLGITLLNGTVIRIDLPAIDWLLNIWLISIIFTITAVSGLTNAYNIIDGFNGLASMIATITLLGIGYIAFKVDDLILSSMCLTLIGSILGFFTLNYPRGLIFLGDSGAYLIGSMVALLSILLVARNPIISPWFAFLVNIYPIFETLFTIWRRKILRGYNPSIADGVHFHTLVYRRITAKKRNFHKKKQKLHVRNSRTSHYFWVLSSLAVIPAIIWWHKTSVLQAFSLLFCISYLWIYKLIINFKTPRFIKKY